MAKIFLSSTYSDLKEYEQAAAEVLMRMGYVYVRMEESSVVDKGAVEAILHEVASCDAFILIVAWSYGYRPERDDATGLSLTDLTYRHALSLNKPCFVFMLDDKAPWPASKKDKSGRIKALREELKAHPTTRYFGNRDDLALAVAGAVASWQTGWSKPATKSSSRAGSKRKKAEGAAASGGDEGGGGGTPSPDVPPGPVKVPKFGVAKGASERNALNDKPQDDINQDELGFKDYVIALRDFVISQDTTTPLTIGINGAWGSGKSSIMRMLQRELSRDAPPAADGTGSAPKPSLLKWLAGYLVGTLVYWLGRLLTLRLGERNLHIRLGVSFGPRSPVADAEFDALFREHLRQLAARPAGVFESVAHLRGDFERAEPEARWWARHVARRVKLVPWRYPTVWFNAWKFNQQEQVWSALALAVLDQMKKNYGFLARLRFLVQLTLRRADKPKALRHALRKFAVPLLLAAAVALYQFYLAPLLQSGGALSASTPDPLRGLGDWPWVAPVVAAVWKAWQEIKDPFRLPAEALAEGPDYKAKVGFIGTFEEDFGRIVEVAVRRSFFWQPRKLVVFIDDLDRCGPLQATGIVEAVNLFLDSVGCVFVLGMDMNAVATSIEVKYKELAERMRKDAPDAASPGSLFLDKIVQIPFNVPRPNRDYIKRMVTAITSPGAPPPPAKAVGGVGRAEPKPGGGNGSAPAPPAGPVDLGVTDGLLSNVLPNVAPQRADRAGFEQEDIRDAIFFASPLLKENPRQVKRFVNLFRLQVYVADTRRMLSEEAVTPRALAAWVAWYMQWPQLLRALSDSPHTRDICEHLSMLVGYVKVAGEGPNAKASLKGDDARAYFEELNHKRGLEKETSGHWSWMPWHLWVKDADFLLCVKELERYWAGPEQLDSLLDMTQVTVAQGAEKAPATPQPQAEQQPRPAAGAQPQPA